ncbi:phospho-sugar mutase [Aquiluna sp.]|nr:phospho-sugar mutase [Aquiluna sp.]
MNHLEAARSWLAQDPDPKTRAELEELIAEQNLAELENRFSTTLQFGTAGLRGELGAGRNRMNRVVVARAAMAIAKFLRNNLATYQTKDSELLVVIGYDGRENSEVFAKDSAGIISAQGIRVVLFDSMVPTPVAAFTGKRLGASATIIVTASHNPPRDNGYKVYLGGPNGGSQLVPPQDAEIAKEIAEVAANYTFDEMPQLGNYELAGSQAIDSYIQRAASLVEARDERRKNLKITHTSLHGVGWKVVSELFTGLGFELTPVAKQMDPDPKFPTVSFPNPEEPGAMDLAFEHATATSSELILANDPDADRLAVAVSEGEGWRMLTGDQVGLILAELCAKDATAGNLANSIVSADITNLAKSHSLGYQQTLTGFKWISKVPDLVYGYEEALGYCVDPQYTPDKDGITAALLIAQLAVELKAQGSNLSEHLAGLLDRYGHIATSQVSIRVTDLSIISTTMANLRRNPPKEFSGSQLETEDLLNAENPTDALVVTGGGAKLIFRPSGTEPKLKCYLQFQADSAASAASGLERLRIFASALLDDAQ